MGIQFVVNGSIDPVAAYAAILSSIIAFWEFLKWHKRNYVSVKCTPNMQFLPSTDKSTYISVTVINRGITPTTITNLLGYHWNSYWNKLLNKERTCFIINSPGLPKVINPGEQWHGFVLQDKKIKGWASSGYLLIGIAHSMSSKEILQRVQITDFQRHNL